MVPYLESISEFSEKRSLITIRRKSVLRFGGKPVKFILSGIKAVDIGVIALALLRVLAEGLSKKSLVAFYVEDIVEYLEENAEE